MEKIDQYALENAVRSILPEKLALLISQLKRRIVVELTPTLSGITFETLLTI